MLLMLLLHLFVVLAQVLSNFSVTMLVIGDNDLAVFGRCDSRFAVEFARQITLPVLFIFAHVLDPERMAIVDKQRFAALA